MLDYKLIKDNLAAVMANIADRFMQADADLVDRLYDERNAKLRRLEHERRKRNDNAASMKGKLECESRQRLIYEGKAPEESIAALEAECAALDGRVDEVGRRIPNLVHPSAPKQGRQGQHRGLLFDENGFGDYRREAART